MSYEINLDTSNSAPDTEPLRQRYFIEKLREYIKKKEETLGRKLTMCVTTFGCQMNSRDSEKLVGILKEIGYVETDTENADFVLYNTCTVRENANQRVYGRLGQLGLYKRKNKDMIIALCGCMMQEEHVVAKIRESYKLVDIIFGTHNIYKLAELLFDRIHSKGMIVDVWKDAKEIVENLPNERKYSFKSGVNITFGCNNFCSYCIVPYVRGRERSREKCEIIKEIERLVADGVVEVMLLGQNVNSYGKDLKEPISFAQLLREIEKVEGLQRIRFMTPHPKDLSDELIEVIKESKKVCKHIHLPLQSGSTKVLKDMNRRYTKEQYLDLVDKIKKAIPDVAITTDIIVGFPGETEEDFMETVDVCQKVKYDSAYTFIYSKRSNTPAAAMDNQVPDDIVKDRFNRLLDVIQESSASHTAKLCGTDGDVLVESVNEQDESFVTGRLSNNTLVHFKGGKELIGSIVKVHLKESKNFYYIGEMKNE